MEIKLTMGVAARMLEIWMAQLEANRRTRSVEGGAVKLDSVPSARGAVHRLDGSVVQVVYKAANPPTERQIREAEVATRVVPRQQYTGRLIDIKRGQDGTVYFLVKAIERRDEDNSDEPAFRTLNPSKGRVFEMTINPAAITQAAGARG